MICSFESNPIKNDFNLFNNFHLIHSFIYIFVSFIAGNQNHQNTHQRTGVHTIGFDGNTNG